MTGEILDGRYVVGAKQRETVTTTRFLAFDAKTTTSVEVEALDVCYRAGSRAARALLHEAELAARVDHPNVAVPLDIGKLEDGTPYVVRRCTTGETLTERLGLTGALPIADVLRVGLDLLSVLAAAHEAHVVHGAVHPDHVFLVEHEGVLLQSMISGFGREPRDRDDEVLGFSSIVFSSPERIDGCSASVASDIYGVAALLFVAATGMAPFVSAHSRVPKALLRVLVRALDSDPERRFPTARAMMHALLVVRVELGSAYAPAEESVPPPPQSVSGVFPCARSSDEEEAPPTRPSAPEAKRLARAS